MNKLTNTSTSTSNSTSMNTLTELERTVLAQQPITIPQNPFYEVLTRFGRDEAIAMIVNVAGTAGLSLLMQNGVGATLSKEERAGMLALVGPVVEKIGFFPAHIKEARDIYRTTPEQEREAFSYYLKQGLKNGGKSLLEDVMIHDPFYAGLMYKGLQLYPETPAWMMATLSFVGAVFAVAGLEVGYNEMQYVREKRKWKKLGFEEESYYEARFLMSREQDKDDFLGNMIKNFRLQDPVPGKYHDIYVPNKLPTYSGRSANMRLRRRVGMEEQKEVKTVQIVYTRAAEMATKKQEQFRYFLSRKDKLYFMIEGEMPQNIEGINAPKLVRKLTDVREDKDYSSIDFERTIARNAAGLLVAVDTVEGDKPFYIVELKVRKDTELLQEAMRYIMLEFPVLHTTRTKYDLMKTRGQTHEI